jgi:hypothetical protein
MLKLILTILLVTLAVLGLALGMLFGRPCIRGRCGGSGAVGPDGRPLGCPRCGRGSDDADDEATDETGPPGC